MQRHQVHLQDAMNVRIRNRFIQTIDNKMRLYLKVAVPHGMVMGTSQPRLYAILKCQANRLRRVVQMPLDLYNLQCNVIKFTHRTPWMPELEITITFSAKPWTAKCKTSRSRKSNIGQTR